MCRSGRPECIRWVMWSTPSIERALYPLIVSVCPSIQVTTTVTSPAIGERLPQRSELPLVGRPVEHGPERDPGARIAAVEAQDAPSAVPVIVERLRLPVAAAPRRRAEGDGHLAAAGLRVPVQHAHLLAEDQAPPQRL